MFHIFKWFTRENLLFDTKIMAHFLWNVEYAKDIFYSSVNGRLCVLLWQVSYSWYWKKIKKPLFKLWTLIVLQTLIECYSINRGWLTFCNRLHLENLKVKIKFSLLYFAKITNFHLITKLSTLNNCLLQY